MSAPRLTASLAVPTGAAGAVLVAVRSAPERREPARVAAADFLHHFGFASLLASLEADDEATGTLGVERLAGRVADAVRYLEALDRVRELPIGILAIGDAVAPVLIASAHLGGVVALVASGGHPDLAGSALAAVRAPVLLVAGERAEASLESARAAARAIAAPSEVAVVEDSADPNAEPEGVGTVCWLARRWFADHLGPPAA